MADLRRLRKRAMRQIRRARDLPDWFPERFGAQALADIEIARKTTERVASDENAEAGRLRRETTNLARLLDRRAPLIYRSSFLETMQALGLALVLLFVLRAVVFGAYVIPSGSMRPALVPGDRVFALKLPYGFTVPGTELRVDGWRAPARGEVFVFGSPERSGTNLIKRIVGLPGDTIEVRGGTVLVNGRAIERTGGDVGGAAGRFVRFDERLGDATYTVLYDAAGPGALRDMAPLTVPAGHYFAMGDNRDHSIDSRAWGLVPAWAIRGKALWIYLSLGEEGRWDRIGQPVN